MSRIFQLDDAGLAASSKQEQFLREAAEYRLLRSIPRCAACVRRGTLSTFPQSNSLRPLHRPS